VRKHSRSERALEAGSPVAKPRARWRVPSGTLVDGRHFGSPRLLSLTRAQPERLSLPRSDSVSESQRGRTRSVRGQIEQPCTRLKTPRRGGIARCGARPFFIWAGLWSVSPKLERAVKHASTWGSVSARRQNAARSLRTRFEAMCGQLDESRSPGNRTVCGCSCRRSVAEVGKTHLPRVAQRCRKASQGKQSSSSRQFPSRRRWVWPRRTKRVW
jgi:hypothetical protein